MKLGFLPVFLLALPLLFGMPRAGKAAPDTATAVVRSYLGWTTPRPPYPEKARMKREQGKIFVDVTTDKAGVVTKATASVPIQQTQDVSDLGVWSVRWVLARWHGPPNVKRRVVMEYRLR